MPLSDIPVPLITSQPVSQVLHEGGVLRLRVVAESESAMVYEWAFNGLPIPGADSAELTMRNVKSNSSGVYSVKICNSNGCVISDEALLEVVPFPTLPALEWVAQPSSLPLDLSVTAESHESVDDLTVDGEGNAYVVGRLLSHTRVKDYEIDQTGLYCVKLNSKGLPALVLKLPDPITSDWVVYPKRILVSKAGEIYLLSNAQLLNRESRSVLCKWNVDGSVAWCIDSFDEVWSDFKLDEAGNSFVASSRVADKQILFISSTGELSQLVHLNQVGLVANFLFDIDRASNLYVLLNLSEPKSILGTLFEPSDKEAVVLIKFTKSGEAVWRKEFITAKKVKATALAASADGELFIFGEASLLSGIEFRRLSIEASESYVNFLCKFSNAGEYLWSNILSYNWFLLAPSLQIDVQGRSFIMMGFTKEMPRGNFILHPGSRNTSLDTTYLLSVYDSVGNLSWLDVFTGFPRYAVDRNGGLIVAGMLRRDIYIRDVLVEWEFEEAAHSLWVSRFGN